MMDFQTSPYLLQNVSVRRIMLYVLAALLPGIAAYVWQIGPAILVQITLATLTALASEALMLKLRGKPLALFLGDGSAVVTAWLIALTFPPLGPWWLIVAGTAFAIIVAKHLYGGLGQNPFNPAMVAFAVCIVSFPVLMSQWPPAGLSASFGEQLAVIFGWAPRIDAFSGATALSELRNALRYSKVLLPIETIVADKKIFGSIAGRGWEWISLAYLLGGLWLWRCKIIDWRQPLGFITGLTLIAGAFWLFDAEGFASPLFHFFSGGAMLGAFFIITDPISGCTTPRGKLLFGFFAGLIAYVIRVFGGYPDGVAFAVLFLNICVPLIDMRTQPPVFGLKK